MAVTVTALRHAILERRLSGLPVCLHSSLRSFGRVAGGARTVIDAFLAESCTLLVPTFSFDAYAIPPPPDLRPARNGWRYQEATPALATVARTFTPASDEIDGGMGAIPAAVLATPGRVRGNHPLCSFTAVGPLAARVMAGQAPRDVFAPLRELAARNGAVVCAGVDLTSLTLLHAAEQRAARALFQRWALGADGQPEMVEVGGCSNGFERLSSYLSPVESRVTVGESHWRIFPAHDVLERAERAIRRNPNITACADPDCERCIDAIAGGPLPLP